MKAYTLLLKLTLGLSALISFPLLGLSNEHCPFIVFSPPKCGTHLIGKVLKLMLNEEPIYMLGGLGIFKDIERIKNETKNHRFIVSHHFTPEIMNALVAEGYKVIFTLRDPRDQIVSCQDWLREGEWYWLRVSRIEDKNEQLLEMITGERFGWQCYESCIGRRLNQFKKVKPRKACYITRFENLIGATGNGDGETQLQEIVNLAEFLNFNLSPEKCKEVATKSYGKSRTFRKGEIGRWKSTFLPSHKKVYKILYSKTLIKLGYEKDTNW